MSFYSQVREALKNTTPGPWFIHRRTDDGSELTEAIGPLKADDWDGPFLRGAESDHQLVAFAPALATEYLAKWEEHEALKAQLEELVSELDYYAGGGGHEQRVRAYRNAAARIRDALKGVSE